ncbi:hypothetical protein J2752_002535 [Halarchaeum rubridurum]|uniref:Uncharacterized protein n=1 Tax=Halarchaeum rubridurum TaxID=489911 RepID=A0A8T4GSS5_9EURY|nr:hypothetical protein [Halarchaeum rubridurum]
MCGSTGYGVLGRVGARAVPVEYYGARVIGPVWTNGTCGS